MSTSLDKGDIHVIAWVARDNSTKNGETVTKLREPFPHQNTDISYEQATTENNVWAIAESMSERNELGYRIAYNGQAIQVVV